MICRRTKRILTILLLAAACFSLCACQSREAAEEGAVFVFYTNDIHGSIMEKPGFSGLAALKEACARQGTEAILVDCGDASVGDTAVSLSHGVDTIRLMNAAGYDVAIPGNHEFDYSADTFQVYADTADFPYICATLFDGEGNTVLPPWTVVERGGKRIAFVGALTPLTVNSENAALFTDRDGKKRYDIPADGTGEALYSAVQSAVDGARQTGADCVILLSHLGTNDGAAPYRSIDVIGNTEGIDVVLDGHSHSVIEEERIPNKTGKPVLLSSTGCFFENVGCLCIHADGTVSSELLDAAALKRRIGRVHSAEAEAAEKEITDRYEETARQVVGHAEHTLYAYDPQTGELSVGKEQTELGAFCADAIRDAAHADAAIISADRIYADIEAGKVTGEELIFTLPLADRLCVVTVTGLELAEALEWSVSALPESSGRFLQVSGLCYAVDSDIASPVMTDEAGAFCGISGKCRVSDITVNGEPLEPDREYLLAGDEHILKYNCLGYSMFSGSVSAEPLDITVIDAVSLRLAD